MSARIDECNNNNSDLNDFSAESVVSQGNRNFFKIVKALNLPRGAPGRLSTVFVSLARKVDQFSSAVKAKEASLRAAAVRKTRIKAKEIAYEREKPLVSVLESTGLYRLGDCLLT